MTTSNITPEQFSKLKAECRIANQLLTALIVAENQAVENIDDTHDFEVDPYDMPHIKALGEAITVARAQRDSLTDQRIKARKILGIKNS